MDVCTIPRDIKGAFRWSSVKRALTPVTKLPYFLFFAVHICPCPTPTSAMRDNEYVCFFSTCSFAGVREIKKLIQKLHRRKNTSHMYALSYCIVYGYLSFSTKRQWSASWEKADL